MEYRVIKPFDKFKIGETVSDSDYYIRRKIAEGGCLEKMDSINKNKMEKQPKNKGAI